ncbi:MAG: DNA-processing protein DprA [Bacteroidales bacterium]|nr:DNA-processing protein DprA [Bacteroidales bacterium]
MLLYQIALTLIPNVGNKRAKDLIDYCGSAEAVFKEKNKNLLKIPSIGGNLSKSLKNPKELLERAEKEVKFIEKYKIKALFYMNDDYPIRLKEAEDCPPLLYYRGNANLDNVKVLSIVGTRTATDYGKTLCKEIIKDLHYLNPLIVSGLAYGIDISAHKAALDYKLETVAALGHGLDTIYPYLHKNIAIRMLEENGGLLSAFPSETKPDKMNFPARNAIIAGLADCVLVVESKNKGGALITAGIANSYNRDVFAVPGKAGDVCSAGCNFLIKTNRAALVENAEDIIQAMNWDIKEKKPKQAELFYELNEDELAIVEILKNNEEATIDFLARHINLSYTRLAELLLTMELNGIIRNLPGKIYKLN